ncbi:MAG: hypothetical protein M3128_03055 [Verrucomicrobiota bacterium]|nr:hypothetical protein [Verrucomicrobiota bacterium]
MSNNQTSFPPSFSSSEDLIFPLGTFDNRSMRLNFELNVLAKHPARTAELEEVLLGYFADSKVR